MFSSWRSDEKVEEMMVCYLYVYVFLVVEVFRLRIFDSEWLENVG